MILFLTYSKLKAKYLSELATRSGFLFQQIPNYLNLNSRVTTNDDDLNTITDEMFGTHLDTELFGKSLLNKKNKSFGGITGLPGFIFSIRCWSYRFK